MSTDRDFDHITRAWLDLMPDEAPDRVVEAVLEAVVTSPQVRPSWWRPSWRLTPMNRLSLIAAAAALVVLVGGGIILTRGPSAVDVGGSPSPTPSSTPSNIAPSADPGAQVPIELRYAWGGAPRPIQATTPDEMAITFSATAFVVTSQRVLGSVATSLGAGELELVTSSDSVGCAQGTSGRYRWLLSPGGSILTIELVDDACAPRATLLPGAWYRLACKDPSNSCLGQLEAGTFRTQFIAPRYIYGDRWTADFGAITYTVPDGWANAADWPNMYALRPSTDYEATGTSGWDDGSSFGIYILTRPSAAVQDGSCGGGEESGVGRTVDELVDWVVGHPGIIAGDPIDLMVGAHRARMIDVAKLRTWRATCPDLPGDVSVVSLMNEGHALGEVPGWGQWQLGVQSQEVTRLIFVDLGAGAVVLIAIDAIDGTRFDELVAAAMPIVESFEFK